MNNIKKSFLVIALLFGLNVFSSDVSAATHGFELEAVACSKELYQQEDMYEVYEACKIDYLDGKLNDYILEENGEVEPGSLVLFVNKYIYGGTSEIKMYTYEINYDSNYWENYDYEGEEVLLYDIYSSWFSKCGLKSCWQNIVRDNVPGLIPIYGIGSRVFDKSQNLLVFGLTLKNDVSLGAKLNINFNKDYSRALIIDNDSFEDSSVITKGITLRVAGDNSYLNEIKSNKYTIKREENEEPIVIGAEPITTINEFLNNFENNDGTLHVYDKDGNEIVDYNKNVGSYMKIKLIDNNEVKDELTIIVRGDFDGNSIVDIVDSYYLDYIIVGIFNKNYIRLQIGDIDGDGKLSAVDQSTLTDYITKVIPSLNK